MKIEVHTKANCPWCARAKEYLSEIGLAFTQIAHDDEAERNALYDSLGLKGAQRTVPQIVLVDDDGERMRLGGYTDLVNSGIASLRNLGMQENPDVLRQRGVIAEAIRHEPVFTLRPADRFAVDTVEFWISKVEPILGPHHPKIRSARRQIEVIQAWQKLHGTHLPD